MNDPLSKPKLREFFDSNFDLIEDLKIDSKKKDQMFEWCFEMSQKNDIMDFAVNKTKLENLTFPVEIFTGLNYAVDPKNKRTYNTKPTSLSNDKLEQLTFGFEKPQKVFLQYMNYCVKCVRGNFEYDDRKIVEVDDYSPYFNIEDKITVANCPECKSDDVVPRIAQTRSLDEAATVKYICNSCSKTFNPPKFNYRN